MIRHTGVTKNLDNIIVLSLSSVDEDKLLRERVIASLNRLERETLISKSGDNFYFLTNEEQEINREIKQIDIDRHLIVQEILIRCLRPIPSVRSHMASISSISRLMTRYPPLLMQI